MPDLVRSLPAFAGGAAWELDRDATVALGKAHARSYGEASPFPHAVIDGFLGEERAVAIANAFPTAEHPGWKRRAYAEQARMGQLQRTNFDGVATELRWLLSELGGMAFMDFLGALTGRKDLIADPHFTGAGLMATEAGGHLAVHVDFNRDSARHLSRAASILYYAPTAWDTAWGGDLELWDRARTHCAVRIAPIRDRLVVIEYGEDHWHGHPSPLACPPGALRAVVAAHYYVATPSPTDDERAHGAIW